MLQDKRKLVHIDLRMECDIYQSMFTVLNLTGGLEYENSMGDEVRTGARTILFFIILYHE
jgi:hypothetical protein